MVALAVAILLYNKSVCAVVVRYKLQHNTTKLEIAGLLDIKPQRSFQREEQSLAFETCAIAYLCLLISATGDESPDGHGDEELWPWCSRSRSSGKAVRQVSILVALEGVRSS
jgi:hypothetical protein